MCIRQRREIIISSINELHEDQWASQLKRLWLQCNGSASVYLCDVIEINSTAVHTVRALYWRILSKLYSTDKTFKTKTQSTERRTNKHYTCVLFLDISSVEKVHQVDREFFKVNCVNWSMEPTSINTKSIFYATDYCVYTMWSFGVHLGQCRVQWLCGPSARSFLWPRGLTQNLW